MLEPLGDDRIVANIFTSDQWTTDGLDPGESVLQINGLSEIATGFHVYKMAPGCVTVPHEHTCDEQFLILDGDITDHDGYRYEVGDIVLLKTGTRHFSTSENGCTLAVFIEKPGIVLDIED